MEESGLDTAATGLRILMLTDTPILGAGGSERFLRNLLSRLPHECQVDVLQLTSEPESRNVVGSLDTTHVRLLYCPIGAIYGPAGFAAIARIRRMVRACNYDIVQSHHEKSDLINALLPRKPPRLRRLSNRRDMGFLKSGKMRWLMRWLNHRFDRIVAPSAAILKWIVAAEGADTAKLTCIPNGVDTTRFAPATGTERGKVRSELGFDDNHVLIGCVASLYEVKRHNDLIAAFAQVNAVNPHARLLLIGDGPMRDEIVKQIAALRLENTAHLLGDREDISRLLPAMDLFVLASSSEGLSNAILEAQACGLPVIATHVGGNSELVQENCGRLVEAENPRALAQTMLAMLADAALRSSLGRAARAQVEQKHSLQVMVDAYLRLYRDMAVEH